MTFAALARPTLLSLALAVAPLQSALAAKAPDSLAPLMLKKGEIARDLVEPPASCVRKKDTDHPAFHGCIDWHSAVHGTWSLVAYEAMTGDTRYRSLVADILSPAKLNEELAYLRANPGFEMPYGRAWFLRLAIDHERLYRTGALFPIADEAARSLLEHLKREGPNTASPEYDNGAWALGNLLDYLRFRNDPRAAQVVAMIRTDLYKACDPALAPGFFDRCSLQTWALSKAVAPSRLRRWLKLYMPADRLPPPVNVPRTLHQHGLNFSRTWGLWAAYSATRDRRYASSYAAHLQQTYMKPDQWAGDYQVNGHWVPQFGMFAIQPLFGSRAAATR